MVDTDITAFAELIFNKYGPIADLEALKRARQFTYLGDDRNAEAWLMITDKVRELQNHQDAGRVG